MQHTKIPISILMIGLLVFVACATLFKGTHNTVDFNSDPIGAQVYINGNFSGTTPVNLKLESKKTYTIEFKKENYATRTYTITNSVGAVWIILDILAGLIPVITPTIETSSIMDSRIDKGFLHFSLYIFTLLAKQQNRPISRFGFTTSSLPPR